MKNFKNYGLTIVWPVPPHAPSNVLGKVRPRWPCHILAPSLGSRMRDSRIGRMSAWGWANMALPRAHA